MTLELVDATLRPYRDEDSTGGFLRVRVLDRAGQVLAGRCQSEPGLEHTEALADGVLEVLAKHGLIG
jgi:hypothetical protein